MVTAVDTTSSDELLVVPIVLETYSELCKLVVKLLSRTCTAVVSGLPPVCSVLAATLVDSTGRVVATSSSWFVADVSITPLEAVTVSVLLMLEISDTC